MDFENRTLGFVLVHRALMDKTFYTDSHYVHLWVHLLMKANHKEKMHNGTIIKPGSFKTGRKSLAKETGINESKIERILKYLESEQQIEQRKTPNFRIISITNWAKFQKVNNKVNNGDPQENRQKTQLNNDNNETNDKNEDIREIFDLFTRLINKKATLTNKAKKKIKTRLAFSSKERLKEAIRCFSGNRWRMENNSDKPLSWFFDSDEKIETFCCLAQDMKKQQNNDLYTDLEILDDLCS